MAPYNPDADVPDLSGKTILVTGGTAGLGKETLTLLAAHNPAQLVFTGRNEKSAQEVSAAVKASNPSVHVAFMKCDLASLASVHAFTEAFRKQYSRLDIIIGNAGIMMTPPGLSHDGYETQFGTNHVGHAMIYQQLLPLLEKTSATNPDVRIVSLSSAAAEGLAPRQGVIFADLKSTQDNFWLLGRWQRYGQSKLANVLYARELAKHHPKVLSVSVHPGVSSQTDLVRSMGWGEWLLLRLATIMVGQSSREVAFNGVWAATAPKDEIEQGAYYHPVGQKKVVRADEKGDKLAADLWKWTQTELDTWLARK